MSLLFLFKKFTVSGALACACLFVILSSQQLHAQKLEGMKHWPVSVKEAKEIKERLATLNEKITEKLSLLQQNVESQSPASSDSLNTLSTPSDSLEADSLATNTEETGAAPAVNDSILVQTLVDSLQIKTEFLMGQKEVIELNKEFGEIEKELTILDSQEKLLEQLKTQMDPSQITALKAEVEELDQLMTEYSGLLKDYTKKLDNWDHEIESFIANNKEVKALQEEYAKQKDLEHALQDRGMGATPMQTREGVKDGILEKVGGTPEDASAMVLEKIEKATGLMSKAKQKYAGLSDIPRLNTESKNPLKGIPLKYRLVYGGNFSINRGDPSSIDFTFDLGYRLTPKLTLGSGFIYRSNLGSGIDDIKLGTLGWGYRAFADYTFFKQFFLEGAYESYHGDVSSQPKPGSLEEQSLDRHYKAGLVGLGYKYNLKGKVQGKFVVLYNLIHSANTQFSNPVIFRVGIEL